MSLKNNLNFFKLRDRLLVFYFLLFLISKFQVLCFNWLNAFSKYYTFLYFLLKKVFSKNVYVSSSQWSLFIRTANKIQLLNLLWSRLLFHIHFVIVLVWHFFFIILFDEIALESLQNSIYIKFNLLSTYILPKSYRQHAAEYAYVQFDTILLRLN